MSNSSFLPIDRTLSDAITPRQSWLGGIPHYTNSNVTVASPLDCLISYPKDFGGGLTSLQSCSQYVLQAQSTGLTELMFVACEVTGASVDKAEVLILQTGHRIAHAVFDTYKTVSLHHLPLQKKSTDVQVCGLKGSRWPDFKWLDEADCVLFSANIFRKSMNLSILSYE